jgi:hypothetical protein
VSGAYKSFVASGNLRTFEALSPGDGAILRQWQYRRRKVAQAPWREDCGTPPRQLRKYDSERRRFVPGFLRNRALRGSQVKNDLRNFTLELRGP